MDLFKKSMDSVQKVRPPRDLQLRPGGRGGPVRYVSLDRFEAHR